MKKMFILYRQESVWKVTEEAFCHEIFNEKNREGKLRFEAGNTYYLEEEVLLSDGTRMTTGRMRIHLGNQGGDTELEIGHDTTIYIVRREARCNG